MSDLGNKSDLAWQAFRYISDEMSSAERDQFEELLAVDQRAREEVAQAVELSQAVALAQDAVVLPSPWATVSSWQIWSSRVRWMLVGTAACLLVVGVIKLMQPSDDMLATRPSAATQSLAAAWVDSQHLAEDADLASLDVSEQESAADDDVEDLTAIDDAIAADELAVPGWLLAAVSGERVTAPEAVPGALEN